MLLKRRLRTSARKRRGENAGTRVSLRDRKAFFFFFLLYLTFLFRKLFTLLLSVEDLVSSKR